MKAKLGRLALAAAAVLVAGSSAADTATMDVSASIEAACSVGNGTTIAMGALTMIDANGAQTTADSIATNTFPAICTNGTASPTFSYTSANTGTTDFRLKGADNITYLVYTLHQDVDADDKTVTYNTAAAHPDFSASGQSINLPLAVKVTAAEKAAKAVQAYSDTITITVSFGGV